MQKSSTKYQQTKYNNTLKGSYTIIKWDLSQACKDGSVSATQSTWYNTLTKHTTYTLWKTLLGKWKEKSLGKTTYIAYIW